MKANTTREKAPHPAESVREMTETVLKNYEQAMHTGLKLQEEATRWWTTVLRQPASSQDWQKPFAAAARTASELGPVTEKRLEEFCGLMEKNSRAGAELVQKALEAAQACSLSEGQTKWMDFWTSSIETAKSNAETATQIGSKALDSWVDFARKNSEVAESFASKAA